MTRKIKKIPLLITKSENIEGLLTLESANKYKVGLIESINFKTFCALNNQTSNYDNNYVILTKTRSFTYEEPFTYESIFETDEKIIRGGTYYYDIVYTGSKSDLEKLTLSKLGQIFPDDESLDEYMVLFKKFSKQNNQAFDEIKKINEESQKYPSKTIKNNPNSERGMAIYKGLIRQTNKIDKMLLKLFENYPKKIYTIKR